MKTIFGWVALMVGLAAMPVRAAADPATVARFTRLADEYIDGYLAWRPLVGTQLGLHAYDGRITDFSRASLDAERARLGRFAR